jgi:hypothetical protein
MNLTFTHYTKSRQLKLLIHVTDEKRQPYWQGHGVISTNHSHPEYISNKKSIDQIDLF